MRSRPILAITAGDPCGVGPEVVLKALAATSLPSSLAIVVIGDYAVFERTARRLHRRLPAWHRTTQGSPLDRSHPLTFLDCAHPCTFIPGRSSGAAGRASLAYLDYAISLQKMGRLKALVTAPVTKSSVERSHPGFVGQTEHLASAFGVRAVAMMFVSDALRVVLLTRHLPLRRVARAVDQPLIRTALRLAARALEYNFHIRRPRLAVCGLNPHAGEGGLFGEEERRVLLPVIRAMRRRGVRCEGPFAADGFFATPCTHDAVICWYHDQGLIPFKMAARDRGCQISLGLPIIRTSPDHGSAFDIAGRGIAHPGSMIYALRLAIKLVTDHDSA